MLRFLNMLLWFLIIPEFLGLGILKFNKKESKNMVFALVLGYIFSFMLYELIAIPMEFKKYEFMTLSHTWITTILVLFAFSIILNIKDMKKIIKYNFEKLKEFPKILFLIFIIIVGFQSFIGFKYMHEDYDDSSFIAKATIAKDTNTLYKYSDVGEEYKTPPTRQFFSPYPFYTATLSVVFDIHPAILARSIFPVVFIPLAYMVYIMIGNVLFKGDKKKTFTFLIILSVIYMFGAYSLRTNFVFLLYRIWQGKAVLANIIVPFIWLIFLKYINDESKYFYWIVLFITLWGADLVSSMALSIGTLEVAILTLIFSIKDKKFSYLLKGFICVIPSIIYGILYLGLIGG